MTLEDFLAFLNEDAQAEKKYVVNRQRQKEFAEAYNKTETLVRDFIGAKMWCEIGSLVNGYGIICIECDSVIVSEIEKFCIAIAKADNFEVYAVDDDRVRLNIIFHGIKTRL